VIKKPRKNEEAKARYRAVENTTTIGCDAKKTNKHLVTTQLLKCCLREEFRKFMMAF
jgi:hypothetical protein